MQAMSTKNSNSTNPRHVAGCLLFVVMLQSPIGYAAEGAIAPFTEQPGAAAANISELLLAVEVNGQKIAVPVLVLRDPKGGL